MYGIYYLLFATFAGMFLDLVICLYTILNNPLRSLRWNIRIQTRDGGSRLHGTWCRFREREHLWC